MPTFAVWFKVEADVKKLIDASDEDEACEQAADSIREAYPEAESVELFDVREVTKQEVEG